MRTHEKIARALGSTFAHSQNILDMLSAYTFQKMRKVSRPDIIEPPSKTITGRAKSVGKGVIGFLGTIGDTYYTTYDRLKGRK